MHNNYLGIDYLQVIPLCVNMIQQQQKQINDLQKQMAEILKKFK